MCVRLVLPKHDASEALHTALAAIPAITELQLLNMLKNCLRLND